MLRKVLVGGKKIKERRIKATPRLKSFPQNKFNMPSAKTMIPKIQLIIFPKIILLFMLLSFCVKQRTIPRFNIDLTKVPKDLRTVFKIKNLYVAALEDDCTRLTYLEILKDKKASSLTYFMARALSWFKQIYNFEFEKVLSDNGPEFKGSLTKEHPFETMCDQLGIKHIYSRPYRPQTNGKVEAFWKIIKNEFFYPNSFDSLKDLIYNLGNFLFEYNHLRRHGGLAYITPYEKLEKVTELLS